MGQRCVSHSLTREEAKKIDIERAHRVGNGVGEDKSIVMVKFNIEMKYYNYAGIILYLIMEATLMNHARVSCLVIFKLEHKHTSCKYSYEQF